MRRCCFNGQKCEHKHKHKQAGLESCTQQQHFGATSSQHFAGSDGTTPCSFAVPADFGRKLLQTQKPFSSDTYANRFRVFMSIDVEILASGGSNASLVQIDHPTQLMGYLSVVMAQNSIQVSTHSQPHGIPFTLKQIHVVSFKQNRITHV